MNLLTLFDEQVRISGTNSIQLDIRENIPNTSIAPIAYAASKLNKDANKRFSFKPTEPRIQKRFTIRHENEEILLLCPDCATPTFPEHKCRRTFRQPPDAVILIHQYYGWLCSMYQLQTFD